METCIRTFFSLSLLARAAVAARGFSFSYNPSLPSPPFLSKSEELKRLFRYAGRTENPFRDLRVNAAFIIAKILFGRKLFAEVTVIQARRSKIRIRLPLGAIGETKHFPRCV